VKPSMEQKVKNSRSGNAESVWIAAAVIAVAVALFAGRDVVQPVRFLIWHTVSLAWFAVIVVSAWGQGRALVSFVVPRLRDESPLPLSVIALGTGLGLFSVEIFLMAAAGFLNPPALTALVTVVFLLTVILSRRLWSDVREEGREVLDSASGCTLPLSIAGLAVIVSWPFALVPTRAFDALSYHLEVPLRYLQAGRIIDIPENLYSYTPQLNHMLYSLALGLSGSDLAGLVNHLYFVLAIAVLWMGFRDRFSSAGSAWAAAIAALSPVLLIEAVNTGVDWSAAFYTLAALCILASGTGDRRYVVLAGLLAGMAAGCRHQPLGYAIVLPAIASVVDDLTSRRRVKTGNLSLFLAVAVLVSSPWYFRNWVFTGDPIFPLLAHLGGRTSAGAAFVSALAGPKSLSLLREWVALPFRLTFDPLSYSMTATVGVQYLALVPLLFYRRWRNPENRFLLSWLILSFLAWYLVFRTARYAMPVFLVAALWLGAALDGALRSRTGLSRALGAMVVATLVMNAGVFVGLQDYVNRNVGAAVGMRSSSNYLMDAYEVYPAIDYLNRLEPPPGRVLFLGEMRGFYSMFPREVPSHNMPNRLMEMVKEGIPPETISYRLEEAGITHILYNPAEWERMAYRNRSAPLWRLDPGDRISVDNYLENRTDRIFSKYGISVYRIDRE
jgi:4-amino-4-deoxy-L-arabinose transferase-like glycosyltransferase